jgi:hypothetical protein
MGHILKKHLKVNLVFHITPTKKLVKNALIDVPAPSLKMLFLQADKIK